MTDGFWGVESALHLLQSNTEYVSYGYSYSFRFPTPRYSDDDRIGNLNVVGTHSFALDSTCSPGTKNFVDVHPTGGCQRN